jgi:hypothetical protein
LNITLLTITLQARDTWMGDWFSDAYKQTRIGLGTRQIKAGAGEGLRLRAQIDISQEIFTLDSACTLCYPSSPK